MLTGITWTQFLGSTTFLLTGYYVVIGLLYFKKEIKSALQRKPPAPLQGDNSAALSSQEPLMPQIYELMASIKEHMQSAATEQYVVNETIFGLQQVAREYPAIKASRFVPAINNEIIQLSNELLGQPFTDDEVSAIWN